MSWKSRRRKMNRAERRLSLQGQPQVVEMTHHHRKCRCVGGSNAPQNISMVPKKKHEAWHTLFGSLSPYQVAKIISETWVDPSFIMVAVKRDEYHTV